MANEITFLPFIKEHISFRISSPTWIGKSSLQYPYQYAGYEIIKGSALSDSKDFLVNNAHFVIARDFYRMLLSKKKKI